MSANTLQSTLNWAAMYIQGTPLLVWAGNEPAVSIASMVRNSFLNAPMTWPWNRKEDSSTTTIVGQQDYTVSLTDFGFLEKATLTPSAAITNVVGTGTVATMTAANIFQTGDVVVITGLTHTSFNGTWTITAATSTSFSFASVTVQASAADTGTAIGGQKFEVTEVHNTTALAVASTQGRPNAISIIASTPGTNIKIRFMNVPQATYQVTLTYQILSLQFGSFVVSSAANAVGANTSYTGIFTPAAFPAGSQATILGFVTNAVNNGTFTVVSCNSTTLVVANAAGVAETPSPQASAFNGSWAPIPDQYSDVYNNLFLSEALASSDDPRAVIYRQRGVAALLAKADGLSEMQKNAFAQQWLARNMEVTAATLKTQQAVQARAV